MLIYSSPLFNDTRSTPKGRFKADNKSLANDQKMFVVCFRYTRDIKTLKQTTESPSQYKHVSYYAPRDRGKNKPESN